MLSTFTAWRVWYSWILQIRVTDISSDWKMPLWSAKPSMRRLILVQNCALPTGWLFATMILLWPGHILPHCHVPILFSYLNYSPFHACLHSLRVFLLILCTMSRTVRARKNWSMADKMSCVRFLYQHDSWQDRGHVRPERNVGCGYYVHGNRRSLTDPLMNLKLSLQDLGWHLGRIFGKHISIHIYSKSCDIIVTQIIKKLP